MAAGPSVAVRVLGDLSGLSKSFSEAQSKGSAAARGMHEAFTGMLSTLNKTGVLGPFGDALEGINGALDRTVKHAKDIGPAMIGIGGALAGVGVGLAALGSKDEAAHGQLQAAVEATGHSYSEYSSKVEEAIKHQEHFGDTAGQTQDALRILTQATGDPTKALGYLSTATDLAAAKHEDLSSAATTLGKVYNGNTKVLKEFGIVVTNSKTATAGLHTATTQALAADKAAAAAKQHLADLEAVDATKKHLTVAQAIALRNAQEKVNTTVAAARVAHQKLAIAQDVAKKSAGQQTTTMTELSTKLHGQASAAADTFGGRMNALKAKVEDAAASFGKKYGPAISAAGVITSGLGAAFSTASGIMGTFKKTQEDVANATKDVAKATEIQRGASEAMTAASEAQTGAEVAADAAGAPLILVIGAIALAVAALGVVAYVIYRNWKTIWGGMKEAARAVWDWIKSNWPLLLGILLGPIALAAALIYKYHKQILDGFKAIWTWIQTEWKAITAFITAPIAAAWGWISRSISTVVGWFSGLPGDIGRVLSGLYRTITAPVQSAWSWIQGTIATVVGWFEGIPNKIGSVIGSVTSILTAPFRAAFDAIADLWNGTVGKLSFKIPGWVPGLGGKGFSMPQIPHLAQGGLITQTGIVLAHAGEVIAPIEKIHTGPAVVVQNAHFSDKVNVEEFLRQAAWVVRTRKVA